MTNLDRVVIFLHGYTLNRRLWEPQLEVVREAGWTPIALNLPGFGGAPALQDTTMAAFAEYVRQVLLAIGATRAAVVGLSMGGYVAFRLFEQHPDLVRALVLADTQARPDTSEQAQARLENAEKVEAEGYAGLVDGLLERYLHQDASPSAKDQTRFMILENSQFGGAAANRAMSIRPDSRPLLPNIGVPTLIIVGAQDAVTPLEQAQAMLEAIPGAKLEVIENAGHISNLEQPEAFNKALLEFIQKL
jgi:3-oxoadipate enol-lactonase